MAEGHKNGAKDTAKGVEETSEDGKKNFQKTFSVDSKKNYGPQIYGDNQKIEIYNHFYILTEKSSESSESSETDGDSTHKNRKKKTKKKKKYNVTEPKTATVSDGVGIRNKTVLELKREYMIPEFSEESSDSERDISRHKKKTTPTKKEKKKNESNNDDNDAATGQNISKLKTTKQQVKDNVSVQNNQTGSQDFKLECPSDQNITLHSADASSAPAINSSTLRERSGKAKKHPNKTTKTEKIGQDNSKKSTKSFAPVRIGLIQMFCYFLCVVIGYYMEWPLWILPYICYLVFVIINILACISCVRFKYTRSEPDQENDTEAFIWFGFGINDQSTLLKLVSVSLSVTLAFVSSHMFGCVTCTLNQTIILFILSTLPYLTFERKFHLKVLQEQSKVFKDIDNQRLLDSSANNML